MTTTAKRSLAGRDRDVPVSEGSEAFVELVNAQGVDYIFLMPGTDTFPIQEAIAKFAATGRRVPKIISSLHETMAMSAAHGYYMMTGRAQLALVHVDVGTQMVGGMLHNAQRGRAGVVLAAGTTPITMEGELRGGRVLDVHWIQDRRDQLGIVRDYTKWQYALTRTENLSQVVTRAFQVAQSEPAGPVYMTLLREMLMQPMESVKVLPVDRYKPPALPAADPNALDQAADWLLKSERPLLLTGYAGRKAAGFQALTRLADLLAIPVSERRERANISYHHPMNVGPAVPRDLLMEADVILAVDRDVLYTVSGEGLPPADAKIIQIDIDPVKSDYPVWGFPIDLGMQADSATALNQLCDLIEERLTDANRKRIEARRERITQYHNALHQRWQDAAAEKSGETPIAVDWVCKSLADLVDDNTVIVDDCVTTSYVAGRYMPVTTPGTLFKHGGSSMGWGGGAAIGVKLAAPDKTVINLDADGNFIDGTPEASLWAADAYNLPRLTIIFNNHCYYAVHRSLTNAYQDSYSSRSNNFVGSDLANLPDFAAIARACRAYGETVTDPKEVPGALRRGLDRVRDGQSAVLDVHVSKTKGV